MEQPRTAHNRSAPACFAPAVHAARHGAVKQFRGSWLAEPCLMQDSAMLVRIQAALVADEEEAAEAQRVVVSQAVEDEMERLTTELAEAKTRAELALRGKEQELRALRQELAALTAGHKRMLAEAEAALTEAWQAEVDKAEASAVPRCLDCCV
ncbi:uncharacterized protein HaLaN_25022 [Haematococcus lacustris]|uniref:Uncharacterized protein n=1 Tax=Haematococcus lacustris TaxID=44745 RepID=A0A6A0A232_HAELA|nr:uncharacterized protein HaLaN_25022 [Haematococcus lacustris]